VLSMLLGYLHKHIDEAKAAGKERDPLYAAILDAAAAIDPRGGMGPCSS
jgi:hypothetical protein